jgi:hypothetical protein
VEAVLPAPLAVVFLSSLLQENNVRTNKRVNRDNAFFITNIVCAKVTGKNR